MTHRRHVHVDEQIRRGGSGNTPDDVRGLAVIPLLDFFKERNSVGRCRNIGGDVVEALLVLVFGGSLLDEEKDAASAETV